MALVGAAWAELAHRIPSRNAADPCSFDPPGEHGSGAALSRRGSNIGAAGQPRGARNPLLAHPSHTCAPRALSPDAASCCSRPHLARATSRRPSGASARPRDHPASSRRHTRRPRPDPACVPIACVLMLACAVCARRHGVGTVVSTFCLIDIDVGTVLSSQALPPSQPSLPSPRAALYPPPQSQTTPPLTPLAQPRV